MSSASPGKTQHTRKSLLRPSASLPSSPANLRTWLGKARVGREVPHKDVTVPYLRACATGSHPFNAGAGKAVRTGLNPTSITQSIAVRAKCSLPYPTPTHRSDRLVPRRVDEPEILPRVRGEPFRNQTLYHFVAECTVAAPYVSVGYVCFYVVGKFVCHHLQKQISWQEVVGCRQVFNGTSRIPFSRTRT